MVSEEEYAPENQSKSKKSNAKGGVIKRKSTGILSTKIVVHKYYQPFKTRQC